MSGVRPGPTGMETGTLAQGDAVSWDCWERWMGSFRWDYGESLQAGPNDAVQRQTAVQPIARREGGIHRRTEQLGVVTLSSLEMARDGKISLYLSHDRSAHPASRARKRIGVTYPQRHAEARSRLRPTLRVE